MLTPKLRITQRHAEAGFTSFNSRSAFPCAFEEVHCLLQLPRLADANLKQMLIVEIADVGPRWSRDISYIVMGLGRLLQHREQNCLHELCLHLWPKADGNE